MSSVSNGLYFLTLLLVSVMSVIYRKIRHARYLYIKRNVEKVWGARYTLGARYLSKNTVYFFNFYFSLGNNYYSEIKDEQTPDVQQAREGCVARTEFWLVETSRKQMVHHVGVVNGRRTDNTRMHHLIWPGRES